MKKFSIYSTFLCLINLGFLSNLKGQASSLPYFQDFETSNDFSFSNGTQVNPWVYGSAAGNTGKSIYISNDDGVSNTYTLTTISTTHAYKDFIIPAGSTTAKFSFDWKANGQTTLDYLRVWMVPVTYLPNSGSLATVTTDRVKIADYLNLETNWQSFSTVNLDVSRFAGTNMRIIFEWRNNGSLGTQSPAAIDNVSLSIPSCLVPNNLSASNVEANTASLNWTAPSVVPTSGYEYYYSTTNTPPTATTNGTTVNSLTSNISGLTPSTIYYWWVRSVCNTTDKSDWIAGGNFLTKQIPATLPYNQDFTTSNDFYLENGSEVNKWAFGNAAGNTGNSLYISSDNGASNYYNILETSNSHAYRDFAIPAGSTIAKFSFDWKGKGQVTYDYLRVWLAPIDFVPTAGTAIATGSGKIQVGGNFYDETAWQNFSVLDLDVSSFAGSNMRLIFEWKNNATSGTQTPAAVDNISLYIPSCVIPTALTTSNILGTTATLEWTAPTPIPAIGYEYYVTTTNTPPTAATIGTLVTSTSANINGLTPLTTYYWWVRSVCSTTDKSDWTAGPDFKTTQIPATLPYNQDFSNNNDFYLNNGTQVNPWFYGSATGNTGKSLYISNDNGATNTYTLTTISTTQAYRDIAIPAGSTTANFSFDWKANGQTTLDYLRVWIVPSTYSPTAGTQISASNSGGKQVASYFNLQDTWQTYNTPSLDVSDFAGSTLRLVFEWRNNATLGAQTPAAIDNISLEIPSCLVPSATTTSNPGANSIVLGWDAPTPAPATGYEYYISTSNTTPTSATTGTVVTSNSPTATGLIPSTTYYWWVRSVCTGANKSDWIAGPSFITTQIPATLPYNQDFTTTNDFYLNNGTQVNQWAYGSATGNTGKSLYVSNDNGVSNAYTITSLSTTQAYRDFVIPAGANLATLSFDWKANGQTTLDFLKVWLVPASFNPTNTAVISSGSGKIQIGGTFNQEDTWQNYINTAVDLSSFAGTTMRLVFEWRNNATLGDQTPAAIDNINLYIPSCFVPTTLATSGITQTAATLTWSAPSPVPGTGYEYYISTNNVDPTATTVGTLVTTNTATPSTLTNNTLYYWWVRSVCSATDKSIWVSGPSFNTLQIPATIPYIQDFNTRNDFTLDNGTQTNQWVYGAAVGNTGKSLYVSDDNGATNNYDITSLSTVHVYRDIIVPAGTTLGTLSFDWKANGQTTLDYLKVWLVPITYKPNAGTLVSTGSGKIQVGSYFNQLTLWQSYNNTNIDLSSFAGSTVRLVFEWRNNATLGDQTPAAIDNIKLLICNNDTPTVNLTNIGHDSVDLTWNQDVNGASYIVRYKLKTSTVWTSVAVPSAPYPATTNTYSIPTLLPASEYEVEVAAVCNNTAGIYSHHEFKTKCDPTPPNITISNLTTNSALITWNPLAISATYILRWREVGTTTWNEVNNLNPPTNTYQLNGLGSYKKYEVQVANICNGETTPNPWSNVNVFTTERECQIAPPGLTITELRPTSAEITWDPFPGSTYVLRYRKVGIPGWTNINVTNNTYILNGLLELTKYEIQVANICNGTFGNYTEPYYFTTPSVAYCPMASTDFTSEYISKVTATPTGKPQMTSVTTGSNYTDFTGDSTKVIELVQGSYNNQITIDKKLATGSSAGVAVWIDFNRNGYFDLDERILADGPNTNATATATFSVPTDASISIADNKYVVMRVALQKDGLPITCQSFQSGEVEDYMVKISKQGVNNPLNQTDIIIYPNPVSSVLYVKNINKKADYKIYNSAGQLVSSGIILNNNINVRNLINGVYMIDINDGKTSIQKKFIKE